MKKTAKLLILIFTISMVNLQDLNAQSVLHRLDSIIVYEWNEDVSQWEKLKKEEYSYNEMQQLTFEYYWNESNNQWELDGGQEFIFNANGKIIEMSDYQQVQLDKFVFYYDIYGDLDYGIGYERDDELSEWISVDSTSYSFNVNGDITNETDFVWNDVNSTWLEEDKCEYSYNMYGYLEAETEYEWNESNSEWVYDELDSKEYFYDENNYLIFRREYDPPETMKCNYDADGNIIQNLFGNWNPDTDEGVESEANSKAEISYDLSVEIDNMILPFSENNEPVSNPIFIELVNDFSDFRLKFNHKPIEMIYYERDDFNQWESTIKALCYYSEQNTTLVNAINKTTLQIYPNPATNFVQLLLNNTYETFTFQLFDIQGRSLLNKEISNNEKIDLSSFERGVYLYKINAGRNIESGKLIKE